MITDELRALARKAVDDPEDDGKPFISSGAWTERVDASAVEFLAGFLIGRSWRDLGVRLGYVEARALAEEELRRRHDEARLDGEYV